MRTHQRGREMRALKKGQSAGGRVGLGPEQKLNWLGRHRPFPQYSTPDLVGPERQQTIIPS
jgi:hypothetical protein